MQKLVILCLVLALVACSTEPGLPLDKVYLSDDGALEIRPVSASELDIRDGSTRYPARYTVADGNVRVVVQARGMESVHYFTLAPDLGLIAENGQVLHAVDSESEVAKVLNHGEAQVATMRTLRSVGTALMAWLTDQVAAASAGGTVAVQDWPPVDRQRLEEVLVPEYLQELPLEDGWGHPIEFRVDLDDPLAIHVFFLRSPGADGQFDTDVYETGPFDPAQVNRDIVWGDGTYLSWPERVDR